ncbi:MAG: glycosyltransferase [Chloroflexota bacterium]|nr:glycosyltransferase [Chloroflexota bacterium]
MITTVTIVIPVYNEEIDLPDCISQLVEVTRSNKLYEWRIVIADNASVDSTRKVAESLARDNAEVEYIYIPQKGRGRALRSAWLNNDSDILCYMDVDLSTDLKHLPELLEPLQDGYQISVGSRLSKESHVTRSFKRELISRVYNAIIKLMFFTSFPDAQCGFKAIKKETADMIIPLIVNNYWFFDTEMLLIAAKRGFAIKSVPVNWYEDPKSSVNVTRTAIEDIKGLLRLRFGGIPKID